MTTQHTSGPWQHGVEDEGYFIANGELRRDIAKCIHSRADADLIAAAPDLLAALQRIVPIECSMVGHRRGEFHDFTEPCPVVKMINAAIAKATGEQP